MVQAAEAVEAVLHRQQACGPPTTSRSSSIWATTTTPPGVSTVLRAVLARFELISSRFVREIAEQVGASNTSSRGRRQGLARRYAHIPPDEEMS